jgi:hypothetical protein
VIWPATADAETFYVGPVADRAAQPRRSTGRARAKPQSFSKSGFAQAFDKALNDFRPAEGRQRAGGAGSGLQRGQRLRLSAHLVCVDYLTRCGGQPVVKHAALGAPCHGCTQETLSVSDVAKGKMRDTGPADRRGPPWRSPFRKLATRCVLPGARWPFDSSGSSYFRHCRRRAAGYAMYAQGHQVSRQTDFNSPGTVPSQARPPVASLNSCHREISGERPSAPATLPGTLAKATTKQNEAGS